MLIFIHTTTVYKLTALHATKHVSAITHQPDTFVSYTDIHREAHNRECDNS